MDGIVIKCPNCGDNVKIDAQTRKGICEFCGTEVLQPRGRFNSDETVQNELALCYKNFQNGDFITAKKHADGVLAISIDNAPALYAEAYYDTYASVKHTDAALPRFFDQVADLALDEDEMAMLLDMFKLTRRGVENFEVQILRLVCSQMNNAQSIVGFVDDFCPFLIAKRGSIAFFTSELAELYKQLAARCTIPKTCYALLQAIDKNPASPILHDEFFLRTKTRLFYENYMLPLGGIISSMNNEELKTKFYHVYQSKLLNYQKKLN